MGVSPPLLVRCHNHSRAVVLAGPPVAPPGLRETPVMHSRRRHQVNRLTVLIPPPSSLPLPFPLYPNCPFLFLSPPPRRIPYNPPRDPPSLRPLFLLSLLVSFLPFADLPVISPPCRFGVPTTGPPFPLSTLLHVTEGCDLCHEVICCSDILYLSIDGPRKHVPCRPLRLFHVFRSPLISHALNNCDPSGLHSQL